MQRVSSSKRAWVAALLAGSLLGLVVPSEPAGAGMAPTCAFSAEAVVQPGLSTLASSGTFASEPGRDGSYECRGPFGRGKMTGKAGADGRYGTADADSCRKGGEGVGKLRAGKQGGDFTFTYSPFDDAGVATGEFHSTRFNGTFKLTALEGDCVLAPVTRVRLEGRGAVSR